MIQIHYKVCPAAYAALTGKGNKLVIATWIRFIENTHSGGGVEIEFGFVMQCFANKLLLTCGAKMVRSKCRHYNWAWRRVAYKNAGVLLGGRVGDGDRGASDVREVDLFGMASSSQK